MSPSVPVVRSCTVALVAAVLSGCKVGPSFRPEPVVGPTEHIGSAAMADSTRAFFDSLAAARAADSGRVAGPTPYAVSATEIADLAWLDVLEDSVLVELVRTAVAQNRDLAVARALVSQLRALRGAAKAFIFPEVTASAAASRNRIVFGGMQPFQYNALLATANLAWELDFWGGGRRGLEAANEDLAAQSAAERATVLSLVSDVATTYLQILELDQEAAISERTLYAWRATLELARQRFAQGITSEIDVVQFEAQLAVPAARLAQVENQRAQQEHALSLLLGQAPGVVPRGPSLLAAARAVTVPDSVSSNLLERRPDVQQALHAYAAANARIGLADAARLPAISIGASYGTQATNASNLFTSGAETYQLQAGISVPLFDGGRRAASARAARAGADQSRAAYERSMLTALAEAGNALAAARSSRDIVTANQTQAEALRRALELALLRYQSGVSSYLEVLDAQRALFQAELGLAQASLLQLTAGVQLYKALGGSWPQ